MIGIYKVTNKINNKVYIGQSINIENRFQQHKNNCLNENLKDYNTKFYRALRKYGVENFTFEIIEELKDKEKLNEREKYWVSFYNSFKEGYNSNTGGEKVTESGELHPNAKNSNEAIIALKKEIIEGKLSHAQLGEKYGISSSEIGLINLGKRWSSVGDFTYPLRKDPIIRKGSQNGHSVFSDEQVMDIRKRYVNESGRKIYEDYKDICSYTALERVLLGKTYTYLPIYKKKEQRWINPNN